jgi:rubrerythrin
LKHKNPEAFADYLTCLSVLEEETYLLYKEVAEKVEAPLIKALLGAIALDSEKHAEILKGISLSIREPENKQLNCTEIIGQTWQELQSLRKEFSAIKTLKGSSFKEAVEKLHSYEYALGEEYYMFIQIEAIGQITTEINKIYTIDIYSAKNLFLRIIKDEERHLETLDTIKQLLVKD